MVRQQLPLNGPVFTIGLTQSALHSPNQCVDLLNYDIPRAQFSYSLMSNYHEATLRQYGSKTHLLRHEIVNPPNLRTQGH